MEVLHRLETKCVLDMKSIRSLILISILLLFKINSIAQPVWIPGTPVVTSTTTTNINSRYGIDRRGMVYLVVYNFNNLTPITSLQVKNDAIAGPSGNRVFTSVLNVPLGQVGISIPLDIFPMQSGTLHSLFWVAEDQFGVLQVTPVKILAATKVCPKIQLFTFFGNLGECVNLGAQGMFQAAPLGILPTGILNGTTWTIDWGDGSPCMELYFNSR